MLYGPYVTLSYLCMCLGVVEIPCGDIRSDSILLVDINCDILTDRCLEKFRNRENTGETLSVSFPDFRIE